MRRIERNALVRRSAATAVLLGAAAVAVGAPPAARVKEIGALLEARPSGIGAPCTDRAAWEELGRRKDYQGLVASAARLLEEPLPEQSDELFLDYSRTGNRKPWETVAYARRGRVRTLVVAECVENQGRFVPAIEDLVRALCAEPTWVYPAHDPGLGNFRGERIDIDLGSAYLAGELAAARYVLGDKLDEDAGALIDRLVRARVLDPFRDMVLEKREANWWLTGTNNWNSVCLAGVTGAALALLEDPRERAFYVAAAEHYSKHFLGGFTADGYCSEGLAYWNYGFGHYAQLAEVIHRATRGRVDLLAEKAARRPAGFGARAEILGGVYPAFADCPMNTRPDAALTAYLNRRLGVAAARGSRDAASARQRGLVRLLAFAFARGDATSAQHAGGAEATPLRTWFEDAGVLICRPEPGGTGRLGVALKGGHNAEHHNHNDVGSFIVVVGDRPVLVDPGTEVYTARTFSARRYESKVLNSYGHPVPVVAGALQRSGKDARGRVLKTEFEDDHDTIALDLRSAYDVPALQRLEREFRFERGDAPRLVVTDRVAFAERQEFELALVTFGTWIQIAADRLRVDDGGRAVEVELITGGLDVSVTGEVIDEDVRTQRKPTRIAIRFGEPVRSAEVTLRITPVAAEAKP